MLKNATQQNPTIIFRNNKNPTFLLIEKAETNPPPPPPNPKFIKLDIGVAASANIEKTQVIKTEKDETNREKEKKKCLPLKREA